jgi:hypothetical protein
MNDPNGRTHEPNLRELCAELDGFKQLMDERDKRYDERDRRVDQAFEASRLSVDQGFRESKEAVSAALAAAKEQTAASFLASEKAIVKAEGAQNAYNTAHNDLLRKQELLVPRLEFESRHKSIEDKFSDIHKTIDELRKAQSTGEGRGVGTAAFGDRVTQIVPMLIAAAALVAVILKG